MSRCSRRVPAHRSPCRPGSVEGSDVVRDDPGPAAKATTAVASWERSSTTSRSSTSPAPRRDAAHGLTIAPMLLPRSGRDADRDLHFLLQRSQFANREVGVVVGGIGIVTSGTVAIVATPVRAGYRRLSHSRASLGAGSNL